MKWGQLKEYVHQNIRKYKKEESREAIYMEEAFTRMYNQMVCLEGRPHKFECSNDLELSEKIFDLIQELPQELFVSDLTPDMVYEQLKKMK